MQRITEPELMTDSAQARAYAEADFTSAHQAFIDLFQDRFAHSDIRSEVLDLGCGPCDITRRFARAFPHTNMHAVDGSPAMLQEAERLNRDEDLSARIRLIESCLPTLQLPQTHYHTIISNSLLHHLHNPHHLWHSIKQHTEPFANIFIMDLYRPDDNAKAQQLVVQYAADEPELLRRDFYHSLCAAFTPDEVNQQLADQALSQLKVDIVSDRHMIIFGTL